jgi:hypothetical protein
LPRRIARKRRREKNVKRIVRVGEAVQQNSLLTVVVQQQN